MDLICQKVGTLSKQCSRSVVDPDQELCAGSGSVMINSGSDKLQFLVAQPAQVPVDLKNLFFKVKIHVAVLFQNFGVAS